MRIVPTSDNSTWHQAGVHTRLSAETYITNSLQKLAQLAEVDEFRKCPTPMSDVLHPELDMSELLRPKEHHLFRAIIGSLNWMVILGRIDIAYATNTLARFSMAPRIGQSSWSSTTPNYYSVLSHWKN